MAVSAGSLSRSSRSLVECVQSWAVLEQKHLLVHHVHLYRVHVLCQLTAVAFRFAQGGAHAVELGDDARLQVNGFLHACMDGHISVALRHLWKVGTLNPTPEDLAKTLLDQGVEDIDVAADGSLQAVAVAVYASTTGAAAAADAAAAAAAGRPGKAGRAQSDR